ncbi:MAG TPA: DUF2147 domain-containing protein [Bryobacteraceae bacterium]|nr:DUF2147 domain-containing protein [Bryobacteraceae bacterium]
MKRLLALAAFLFASSAAHAQYTFQYGGHTIHIDPDRGTVSIPGVYGNTGRKSKRARNTDQGSGHKRPQAPQEAKVEPQAPASPAEPATAPQAAGPAVQAALPPAAAASPPATTANNAPAETTTLAPLAAPPAPPAAAQQDAAFQPASGETTTVAPPPAPPAPPAAQQDAALQPAPAEPPSAVISTAPPPPAPAPQQTATAAPAPAAVVPDPNSPLGVWLTEKNEGKVRIEQCGSNLCGYSVDAKSNLNGEKVLINMKPGRDQKWSGRIFDPNTGSTYDSSIALKGPDRLRVQGCAFGGMFCGAQTWTRVN